MHLQLWLNNKSVEDFDLEEPDDQRRLADHLNRAKPISEGRWEVSSPGDTLSAAAPPEVP